MKRGFIGIALYEPKFEDNLGTIFRSAMDFDIDFIMTIGHRYKKQPTDTTMAYKHIPLFHFKDTKDFLAHIPQDCELISVEVDGAEQLETFTHPERAIYILGGEDRSVPKSLQEKGKSIKIATRFCLNLAVCASIVMYDRNCKALKY
jgi:tRNA(Leu) C34 or U34 (ribose-2'-O)-methylase TrmL